MTSPFRRMATVFALVGVLALVMSACAITADSAPRDVSSDERDLLLTDASPAADTVGDGRIYLVAPSEPSQQRQLRSVQRDVVARPDALLQVLLDGPNQRELDSRLVTAIPSGTTLLSTRTVGDVLFVDLTDPITELTGEALTLAVAQIVFTASGVPGVQAVRLRVDGEDQAWPRGDGQTRQGPLRIFDFPGLVESAQPAYPAVPALT
jgi:hypothetical protein